jgi:streptogramin lyase
VYAETTRVDPATNTVVNVYDERPGDGIGVSAMNGLVWFISDVGGGRITAVDAVSGEHVRDLTVDGPIHHLTAGFGSLWVNPIGRPAVLRIDPETGETLAEVTLSGDSGYLTTSADSIWVAEPHQWLVARIDPTTDRVAAELMAAPGADQIAVAPNGRVWALTDDQLFAFDPATNQEVDRLIVPSHRAFDDIATPVLALDEDRVWFADGNSLERIRPGD